MTHDVFISYAHIDRRFANAVAERLRSADLQVWLDTDQLTPGENWRQEIDDAIANSGVLLVIMTPEAKASEYVTYEWAYALGKGIKVIPIQHAPILLHPRLEVLQYLDFTESTRYPWKRLIQRIRDILANDPIRAAHLAASGRGGATAYGEPHNIVSRILGTTQQALDKHGKNPTECERYINEGRKQIREFGTNGGFRYEQAWWLLGQAIEYYVQALGYDPSNQHAWINLAYVYHVMGQKNHASDCIQMAFNLASPGPNYPGNHYRRVKGLIDTNTYDSGGTVVPQIPPDWFSQKFGQYL